MAATEGMLYLATFNISKYSTMIEDLTNEQSSAEGQILGLQQTDSRYAELQQLIISIKTKIKMLSEFKDSWKAIWDIAMSIIKLASSFLERS